MISLTDLILFIERIIIGLLAVVLYVYLVTAVFPWLTMRLSWKKTPVSARGLSRVTFPEGRGVVYEPDLHIRRYIRKYALVLHEGTKFLQCQTDPRVAYLCYDVLSFDRTGRLLDIVRVSERMETKGCTRKVTLPTETSHAFIVLRRVDGMYKAKVKMAGYTLRGSILFGALTVLTTVAMALFLNGAVISVWGIIGGIIYSDHPEFVMQSTDMKTIVVTAVILGILCTLWTLWRYRRHSRKVVNK